MCTLCMLEYLLWVGVHNFTDHRQLAYSFNSKACVACVCKIAAQRPKQWNAVLGQYDSSIRRIVRERNYWRILLSRWVSVPAVSVRAVAVFASGEPDKTPPSEDAIRKAQEQAQVE